MLTPEYLLRISEGAEEIAEFLHADIINRIIERMMIRINRGESYLLTSYDKWQIETLQEAGFLLEDIQKEISRKTKQQEKEIKEAFEDAGIKTLEYDDAIYQSAGLSPLPLWESPYLVRLMQRNYDITVGEWRNFTQTTASACHELFISEMDKAYNLITSGAVSYTQAFKEAINNVVSEGVVVKYPTGHKDTLETAALRCVRTGVSQMSAQITNARMQEMGWDIILVSSHLGARHTGTNDFKDHQHWQGKFYSKSGNDKRFPPYSECGEGDVQGIHGANCRHSHGPGDGVHNPFSDYDTEENKKVYELQQTQRSKERAIRKSKREVMGLKTAIDNEKDDKLKFELDQEYQRKSMVLQKRTQNYNEFCEENNLKRLQERLEIAKWDRKQAAAARGAAKRYQNAQ